jgi:hypothetical protein
MAGRTTPRVPGGAPAAPHPPRAAAEQVDLLVAASRERTVLVSGFLAGVGVFFAPLLILALGLLAAYLASSASDSAAPLFGLSRPLEAADFRAVFAPAVNQAPVLVSAGLIGAMMAQFRRWLARRADPARLAAGARPSLPEFALLYALLVGFTLGAAATWGGWVHVRRLAGAAPIFLLFMLCATWLTHAVWHYCFRNVLALLASGPERAAASALRGPALGGSAPLGHAGPRRR